MKWLDASTAAEVLKFTIRKVLQKTENLLEKGKKTTLYDQWPEKN